jgi:Rrf2 family transcriptional regulator, nitric oxide-sensitive transcriptional repressor
MIRINRQTDYAIRILLALARQNPLKFVPTSQIRQEMLIPRAMCLRVVAELAKGGFIHAHPGRSGGIQLSRPPSDINLRQVVTQFEKNFTISECLHESDNCPFDQNCPVRCRWARLQVLIFKELETTTFEELAQESGVTVLADVGALEQVVV